MSDATVASGDTDAIDDAIRSYQAGRIQKAEDACRAVLAQWPLDADASNLMAMVACDRGNPEDALAILAGPVGRQGSWPALHNTRARALVMMGRLDAAEAAYRLAWSAELGQAAIANNLGCLLRDRGRVGEAVGWFETAWQLLPGSAEVARNLAAALAGLHRNGAAIAVFQRAIALDPTAAESYAQCGAMLLAWGRRDAATEMLRAALRLDPGHAQSLNNLGLALRGEGRNAEAMACFAQAVHHDAGLADAHYNLGCLLSLANRQDEARASHERALAAVPLHGAALWARCMVELPVLYDTRAQMAVQRARYAEQLAILERRAANPDTARALAASAGASQPFFLPYQGECDRDLQARYGTLMAQVLQRQTGPLSEPHVPGERVRLGIVSGYYCEHTVWRLMLKGWLGQIDRDQFEVTAYHTGSTEDEQTALARRLCPQFVTGPAEAIRAAILASLPHVLLYPEIGMDRVAARLGAERLAPLQCVAWGQPETTGLPTMDVFLSSALMEPAGAAAHYTERLVPLPGLGICYEADDRVATPCNRAEFGLRPGAVVFWCGQALYKYRPQDDDVFARIALQVGDCQFVFIGFAEDPAITLQFEHRLAAAFARHGLDYGQHLCVLAPMPQAQFLGTVRLADIVLDSLGWSGGKSTLDILVEAPVIVTQTGAMMRGRHTAAILTAIGVTDTMAASTTEYCDIAVRLAKDAAWRAGLRDRIRAGYRQILSDTLPIRAMEAVLAGRQA